jgi:hypothetical protein
MLKRDDWVPRCSPAQVDVWRLSNALPSRPRAAIMVRPSPSVVHLDIPLYDSTSTPTLSQQHSEAAHATPRETPSLRRFHSVHTRQQHPLLEYYHSRAPGACLGWRLPRWHARAPAT